MLLQHGTYYSPYETLNSIHHSDDDMKILKICLKSSQFKELLHIHGSHHGPSRILICGVPAGNTTDTVFLLRCTFFKFFKGLGLSLIHGTQHGPSQVIALGSSVLSPASPCIQHDPCHTGISVIKKLNLRNFTSRSTQMKNDPYHSWKATCCFRVATAIPVLRLASSGCETQWVYRWNTVPSRSDTNNFSSCCSLWFSLAHSILCYSYGFHLRTSYSVTRMRRALIL